MPPFLLTLLFGRKMSRVLTQYVGWDGMGWGESKVAYPLQLHRFKLSLPFKSFLPRVTVINLLLYKLPPPLSTLLPGGVGSRSVVPVTTAISGSSSDSVKYCCVCK
jgi:hypothetical protein